MLKNYLKIAWRNLVKNKTFSFINIIGLASGLACFILIALYVADELSYDRYNDNASRIYRINSDIVFGGNILHLAVASDPMGAALKNDYPQVEEFVRFYTSAGSKLIKKEDQYINQYDVAHADSTLFDVFTLPLISGDPKTALNEPNTVVISASAAKKYFGTTDVVGKTIETNDNGNTLYKITAVIRDMPHNSHFNFSMIFSMDNVQYQWGNFLSHNHQTYLLLKPGTDHKAFEKNFIPFIDKYVVPQAAQFMQIKSMDEFEKAGNKLEYSLTPLTDIHLHSDRQAEMGVNGNIQYVYIFSVIAILVLVLACINFMNLSTARSASRAKEVGIRKVVGSEKRYLVRQFITESILTTVLSTGVAVAIAALCLSWFNDLSAKELHISDLLQPKYMVVLIALPVVVGLFAGIYPAFVLSSFNPIVVLKGKLSGGLKSRSLLRNGLVVIQFFFTVLFISGTIVVFRQLDYIQTKKLGFNKDQMLIINGTFALGNNRDAFKNEVSKLPGVKGSAYAGYLPVSGSSRNDMSYSTSAAMNAENSMNMQTWNIDYDYIPVMEMEIIKGRNFSRQFGTDSNATIVNETAAKLLGGDPIGKKIYTFYQDQFGNRLISREVIGVVKNFHFESMKENIGPLCFRLADNSWATGFKVASTDIKQLISTIENKWKSMAPGMPFSYQFMDESFDSMYRVERRTGKLGLTLAIIAVVIACLGLFGLATYTAEQRIKEIGVRKVLGATVMDVVSMLSKDFMLLVLIASAVAVPVAWWVMNKWLEDFAYRINIGWWIFLAAGVIALLIALMTVSSQAIRAAVSNPVKSLRTE
ncbi:MAG TPA: ABC transporter permease [Chitinophagaceae bacterium]|nr:ABC transporter permease [Chitinophagaceae bacterium]